MSYLDYDTNNVNSLLLDHFLNLLESNKREALFLDLTILFSLSDIRILVERQAVVVLDGSELFVGQLDLPIGEQEHLVLSDHGPVLPGRLLTEKGRLNLRAILVDHLDVHQGPLSAIVLPSLWLIFACDTGADTPVSGKLIEDTDRSIHILDR